MGPIEIAFIALGLLLVLIAIGMPVAFAAATAGVVGIVLSQGFNSALYTLGTFPVSRISTFTWTALPLFILMGNLSQASGIGQSAYRLAQIWFGKIKGSLVLVTIATCGLIGATTGTGATGTVIMGKIAMPEMRKRGYDEALSVGAIAASGTVGMLIPPSGNLLVIGILTYLSVAKLFMAGILPGVLSVVVYMIMVFIRCSLNPELAPKAEGSGASWGYKLYALVTEGYGIFLLFFGIMVPLLAGLATPTESAGIGCLVGLILWVVAVLRKRSDFAALKDAVIEAIQISAMVFAFIIGAGIFSLFLAVIGVVPSLINFVSGLSLPPGLIFLIIMLCYVPLGMFLDVMSVILLTVPIVYPVIVDGLGFNGIWFSIVLIKMVELSAITPPIGLSLFVAKGVVPNIKMETIIKGILWFACMDLVTFAILAIFPQITTFLPDLLVP